MRVVGFAFILMAILILSSSLVFILLLFPLSLWLLFYSKTVFIKVNLFLIVAFIHSFVTPLATLYTIFSSMLRRKSRGEVGTYFFKSAYSMDQNANVLMQEFFNDTMRKDGGYDFGNPDVTISDALGRNKKLEKLTIFGKSLERFLGLIDPGHVEKAFEKDEK